MNIVANAHRFFVFGGILLLAIGAIQLLSRPRSQGRSKARSPLSPVMIRAVFFIVMGLLALLAGAGVIPMPGDK
jgi:hypothetical protein